MKSFLVSVFLKYVYILAIHMQVYTISNRGLDSSLPLYYI